MCIRDRRTTWATSIAKTNLVLASNSRTLNLLLGLLGAGALATGAVATGKYLTRKDPQSDMGKIKLKPVSYTHLAEILIDKRSREFFQLLFRNLSLLIQIFIIKICLLYTS